MSDDKRPHSRYKHGHGLKGRLRSLTYAVWSNMKARCANTSNLSYPSYGGRGINYDPRWEDFSNFLLDMGEQPPGLSIDRIDNSAGYTKHNCRWVTRVVQNRNRRRVKLTERDAHQIRWLAEMGYLQKRIASMFKVRACTISQVVSGKRWATKDMSKP